MQDLKERPKADSSAHFELEQQLLDVEAGKKLKAEDGKSQPSKDECWLGETGFHKQAVIQDKDQAVPVQRQRSLTDESLSKMILRRVEPPSSTREAENPRIGEEEKQEEEESFPMIGSKEASEKRPRCEVVSNVDPPSSANAVHTNLTRSPPPARPGAFRVAGIDARNVDDAETIDCSEMVADTRTSNSNDIGGLTVARMVDDSQNSETNRRPQASEVDLEALEQRKQERSKAKIQEFQLKTAAGCFFVLAVLVVVITIVVVHSGKEEAKEGWGREQEADCSTCNNTATSAPSGLMEEQYLLSLLPEDTKARFSEDDSPQLKAFEWILQDHIDLYTEERILQRFVLATLFFGTGGTLDNSSSWFHQEHWLSYDHDECDWWTAGNFSLAGIPSQDDQPLYTPQPEECTEEGVLLHLWLRNNNLEGEIPSEFYWLTSLQSFSLGHSSVSGTISSEIGKMTNLQALGVFGAELSGSIPTEIGALTGLVTLFLSANKLEGSIPSQIGQLTNLRYILLDTNQFTGGLPSELGLLTNDEWLWLWRNQISGTLPTELGQMTNARRWAIDNNPYTGPIPSELGLLKNIDMLYISQSLLTGTIPTELGEMESLELFTAGNSLLSGTLPSELFSLNSLGRLWLGLTRMTGTLPSEIGLARSMWHFDIGAATFGGALPTEIGEMEALEVAALDGNEFVGAIPSEIGLLERITLLHLSQNNLTSTIPTEMGRLQSLTSNLWCHTNRLTGTIPSELGRLSNVSSLKLHNNSLVGRIPNELGFLKSLTTFTSFGNDISGSMPSELCNLTTTEPMLIVDCELVECGCSVCVCY